MIEEETMALVPRFPSYWYGAMHEFYKGSDGRGPKAKAMESIDMIGHHMPMLTRNLSTYIVGGFIQMVEFYCKIKSKHERLFYEIVQGGEPCKLYVDIDLRMLGVVKDVYVEEKYTDFETKLPAYVKQLVAERYGILFPTEPDMIVLDATTPEKFSRHFIFPNVVFASVLEMGDFILNLVQVLTPHHSESEWIDRGIYQPGRNFRIYNSKKLAKDNTLRMVSHKHYCEEQRVMACMITMLRFRDVGDTDSPLLEYATRCHNVIHGSAHSAVGRKRKYSGMKKSHMVEGKYEDLYNEALPLVNKIDSNSSSFHVESSQYGTYLVWGVKVCCTIKGAVHRNNRTFFKVNVRTRKTHFKCMDPECRSEDHGFGVFGSKYLPGSKTELRNNCARNRRR